MSDQQQQPAQQTPEPPKVETKAPEATTEKPQLSETIRAKLLGIQAVQKKEDKKSETPPPAETATQTPAAAAPSTTEPPAEKPKKTKAPAKIIPAPEPQIGEVVTRAATEAAVAAVKATQPKVEAAPEPELPRDIQRKLEVYKELEESDQKYKGLAKKVVEFSKKGGIEEQYITEWKKANPGKQFDPEAEDHEEFYAKNAPDYDENDFEVAKEQIIERRAVEKARKALEPELQKQRHREIEREVEPAIAQASYSVATSALGAISEDLVKVATEKGDAGLEEADPLALQIVSQVIPAYEPLAHETVRLFSGLSKYDEKKPSPTHQRINEIALQLDHAIGGLDREQAVKPIVKNGRVVGYQRFATYAEWSAMSEADRQAHWVVGQDEVLAHISALAKRDSKTAYDRVVSAAAKTLGAKTGQKANAATAPQPQQTTTSTATPPPSPSLGGGNQTPTPTGGEDKALSGKRLAMAKALGIMR